jgi:hypothetical protein
MEKKWVMFLGGSLALLLVVMFFAYPKLTGKVISTPVLITHYKFEDNIADETGMNNGENYGVTFVEGKVGKAARFDGKSYIEVPHAASLDLDKTFSISLWIKPARKFGWQALIERGTGKNSRVLLWTYMDEVMMGINSYWQTHSANMEMENWYHVVVTHDDLKSREMIYINGSLISTRTSRTDNPINVGDLRIGTDVVLSGEYFYEGLMDEIRIYNGLLDQTKILELYNEGSE